MLPLRVSDSGLQIAVLLHQLFESHSGLRSRAAQSTITQSPLLREHTQNRRKENGTDPLVVGQFVVDSTQGLGELSLGPVQMCSAPYIEGRSVSAQTQQLKNEENRLGALQRLNVIRCVCLFQQLIAQETKFGAQHTQTLAQELFAKLVQLPAITTES